MIKAGKVELFSKLPNKTLVPCCQNQNSEWVDNFLPRRVSGLMKLRFRHCYCGDPQAVLGITLIRTSPPSPTAFHNLQLQKVAASRYNKILRRNASIH